jgi:transposase
VTPRKRPRRQNQSGIRVLCIPKPTAAVATMGDRRSFRSGREFAARFGLVPKQTGTGGKVVLLGISKRGDTYLRTLLIHGSRSVLSHAKDPGAWVSQLINRGHSSVAIVAIANKMARTIWAVLANNSAYEKWPHPTFVWVDSSLG